VRSPAIEAALVYRVPTPDYNGGMDVQQSVSLALLEQVAARSVALAQVAQTMLVFGVSR
jgi:hypothetical protein